METEVTWWETAWTATHQSVPFDKIASAERLVGDEGGISIELTKTEGTVETIDCRFI